ncbi:MAG TPA: sialidase family protein, partial [Candidatus Saccharimonadia bacterium]|nr:sialidase family protein [Candidatus Saccharimonadia bacterium]
QDYTVIFHNPDPEYYVEGPGLAKLEDGSLLAVVPVVPRAKWSEERRATKSVTHLLRSRDAGKSWQEISQLPYYSAAPFLHKGTLYLFTNKGGTKSRNDDVMLLKSDDGGTKWSEPVTLFKGHYWNCHTGMVQRDDKIYWATDDLSLGKNRGPRLIAGNLSSNPMDPASWRISEPVAFPGVPEMMTLPEHAQLTSQYLEPNVIEIAGKLRVLCAVKFKRQAVTGLCGLLDASDSGENLTLKFSHYHAMPGGQLKFCIIRDEPSKMFWATANLPADSTDVFDWWKTVKEKTDAHVSTTTAGGNDRRFLMLQYSVDGLNWFPAGCVAQAKKVSQSFMYARPVVDGDDLAIIARSNINGPNHHDADCATFHRVKNFRDLALNLFPEAEGK